MLDFITKSVAEGGLKMLKEIPSLLVDGWEKVKGWISFSKESEGKGVGERAMSLFERIAEDIQGLIDRANGVTEEAENEVDAVVGEASPAAAETPAVAGDVASKEEPDLNEKTNSDMGLKAFRKKHDNMDDFKKAFAGPVKNLWKRFEGIVKMSQKDRLSLLAKFGINKDDGGSLGLGSSAHKLKGHVDTLKDPVANSVDMKEAEKFFGKYFLRSGRSDVKEIVRLVRKLLTERGLSEGKKMELVSEICFYMDPTDFDSCCKNLGVELKLSS